MKEHAYTDRNVGHGCNLDRLMWLYCGKCGHFCTVGMKEHGCTGG